MHAAACSAIPHTHPRGAPRKSPRLHFVPIQQHRLTENSFQSPYFYRASGLAQISVSALLRISSLDASEVLAAEHCRYGTRDFALVERDQFREARLSLLIQTAD
jgi:hypothetical protein